ncbi:MAG: hypothetical protein NVS3B28_01460 [Candidatus Velthaea sp.]
MKLNDNTDTDQRLYAIPDIHGHAKGEHKLFAEERPIPLSARMLFLWFFHACRRGWPRFVMVSDHMNYLTFEDPAAVNLVRRALKLAQAGDLYGAAETASVEVGHAAVVSEGLRRGMRYSIGAEVDNDPRSRPDAQNIVDAMKPDGMIRSVHFLTIDHPVHGPNWNWPFDNPEFKDVYDVVGTEKTWELYMATLLDAIERLPGNIVGHFYVPAVFGHWPEDATLEKYEDQLVEACESRGIAIEFNTRFLYRDHPDEEKQKFIHAHERLLKKAKAKNVGIAIGSDAHSPKDQGGAFTTVLDVLDACEINEIVFPIAGRLARVALRVERKPEPPPAPEPPAPQPEKAVRKARTSESPTRPKDTRPQREDESHADSAPPSDEPTPTPTPAPKAKSRKAKAANPSAQAPELEGQPQPEPGLPYPMPVPAEPAAEPAETVVAEADAPVAKPEAPKKSASAKPVAAAKPAAPPKPIAVTKSVPVKAGAAKLQPVKVKPAVAKPKPAPAPVKKAASKARPVPLKKQAKPAAKPVAKKAPAKAVALKKAPAKKAPLKKSPAKKAAPAKASVAKRAPLKKAPAKKAPAKKTNAKKSAAKRR